MARARRACGRPAACSSAAAPAARPPAACRRLAPSFLSAALRLPLPPHCPPLHPSLCRCLLPAASPSLSSLLHLYTRTPSHIVLGWGSADVERTAVLGLRVQRLSPCNCDTGRTHVRRRLPRRLLRGWCAGSRRPTPLARAGCVWSHTVPRSRGECVGARVHVSDRKRPEQADTCFHAASYPIPCTLPQLNASPA